VGMVGSSLSVVSAEVLERSSSASPAEGLGCGNLEGIFMRWQVGICVSIHIVLM